MHPDKDVSTDTDWGVLYLSEILEGVHHTPLILI
jgi:hypothetical protein